MEVKDLITKYSEIKSDLILAQKETLEKYKINRNPYTKEVYWNYVARENLVSDFIKDLQKVNREEV